MPVSGNAYSDYLDESSLSSECNITGALSNLKFVSSPFVFGIYSCERVNHCWFGVHSDRFWVLSKVRILIILPKTGQEFHFKSQWAWILDYSFPYIFSTTLRPNSLGIRSIFMFRHGWPNGLFWFGWWWTTRLGAKVLIGPVTRFPGFAHIWKTSKTY